MACAAALVRAVALALAVVLKRAEALLCAPRVRGARIRCARARGTPRYPLLPCLLAPRRDATRAPFPPNTPQAAFTREYKKSAHRSQALGAQEATKLRKGKGAGGRRKSSGGGSEQESGDATGDGEDDDDDDEGGGLSLRAAARREREAAATAAAASSTEAHAASASAGGHAKRRRRFAVHHDDMDDVDAPAEEDDGGDALEET